MFSLNHAAQLYATTAAYPGQPVRLDPAPKDNALADMLVGLHTTLQSGIQTLEEATQMPDICNKLVNHSISVNDHHWNNASATSIAANSGYTLASSSAAAPPDTSALAHTKIHTDVASLLVRVQRAENKIEALTAELQQYQDWVRRTLIAEGNVRDQMQQELEMLRPKTLELRSSSNHTRCRSPRRRKPQTHDTSQSHRDPRADRSSGT